MDFMKEQEYQLGSAEEKKWYLTTIENKEVAIQR